MLRRNLAFDLPKTHQILFRHYPTMSIVGRNAKKHGYIIILIANLFEQIRSVLPKGAELISIRSPSTIRSASVSGDRATPKSCNANQAATIFSPVAPIDLLGLCFIHSNGEPCHWRFSSAYYFCIERLMPTSSMYSRVLPFTPISLLLAFVEPVHLRPRASFLSGRRSLYAVAVVPFDL